MIDNEVTIPAGEPRNPREALYQQTIADLRRQLTEMRLRMAEALAALDKK